MKKENILDALKGRINLQLFLSSGLQLVSVLFEVHSIDYVEFFAM